MPTTLQGADAKGVWSHCGRDYPSNIPARFDIPGITYPAGMALRCNAAITTISTIAVKLIGVNHTFLGDFCVYLVKPDNILRRNRVGILMFNALNNTTMTNGTLTIDQTSQTMPFRRLAFVGDATYRATSYRGNGILGYDGGLIPQTSINPVDKIGFGDFIGGYAWGCWQLYFYDDSEGLDSGSVQDWSIVINGTEFNRGQALVAAQ